MSATVQSTSVLTTVSKLPSANGSCSAGACTTSTGCADCDTRLRSRAAIGASGSARVIPVTVPGYSCTFSPVPAPISSTRPRAAARVSRRSSRMPERSPSARNGS